MFLRSQTTYAAISLIAHANFLLQSYLFGWEFAVICILAGLAAHNLAVSVYIHRGLSHGFYAFSAGWHVAISTLCSMMNFGSAAISAAVHVAHHRYADTERDPHSLRSIGLRRFLLKNWDSSYKPNQRVFAKLMQVPALRWQHEHHVPVSIASALVAPWLPVAGYWFLNLHILLVHLGKDEKDTSQDAWWLYPLMWGEEFHRLHHERSGLHRLHRYDFIDFIGCAIARNSADLGLDRGGPTNRETKL